MTNKGYRGYSEMLKEYGYKYCPGCPYDDANSWVKWFVKDESTRVYVSVRVFHKEDIETGEDVYTVSAEGRLEDKERCPHLITLHFGNRPDLVHVDAVMNEATEMFGEW